MGESRDMLYYYFFRYESLANKNFKEKISGKNISECYLFSAIDKIPTSANILEPDSLSRDSDQKRAGSSLRILYPIISLNFFNMF